MKACNGAHSGGRHGPAWSDPWRVARGGVYPCAAAGCCVYETHLGFCLWPSSARRSLHRAPRREVIAHTPAGERIINAGMAGTGWQGLGGRVDVRCKGKEHLTDKNGKVLQLYTHTVCKM